MTMTALNLVAFVILIGITAWYARSTAKMLREMRQQADAVREQSWVLSKSAQIAAKSAQIAGWDSIKKATEGAGLPSGNPLEKLVELVTQLKELDTQLGLERKSTQPVTAANK